MKGNIFFATLIACAGLLPATSHAADGMVCFSSILTHTEAYDNNPAGSTTYPQINNSTRYTCRSTTGYTLTQFMQAGWIVDNMVPVAYSNATTYDPATGSGTVTLKSRWQVVLRHP